MTFTIVDTHTHLLDTGHWPTAWWDHVADEWAAAKKGRRAEDIRHSIEPGLVDPGGRRMVERMDDAGVATSVILPIDWGPGLQTWESVLAANEHAAAMSSAHPGRFSAFVGIDPRRPEAREYVTQQAAGGEAQGLKLYPGCGWHPASREAMRLYELAAAAGLPVLFHTGDPLSILDRELCNPEHLLPVVRELPELIVWVGHSGAPSWWAEACRLVEASPGVRLEMSVWLWDDSGAEAVSLWERRMAEAVKRFGASRLLFGSDHVSGSKVRGERFLATVVDAYRALEGREVAGYTFTADDLELILGRTALVDLRRQPDSVVP